MSESWDIPNFFIFGGVFGDRTREEKGKEAEGILHQAKEEEKEEKEVQVR